MDCLCNVELDVIHIDSTVHRLLSEGIVLCKLITEYSSVYVTLVPHCLARSSLCAPSIPVNILAGAC
jgi:hypothetical protein